MRVPQQSVPIAVTAATLSFILVACSGAGAISPEAGDTATAVAVDGDTDTADAAWFDASAVHDLAIDYDPADYEAMIGAYSTTGEKDWISATVVIDGVTYHDVGLRLKGNSSLRGLSGDGSGPPGQTASADSPETLPWLIRLDKYVDGQNHGGLHDLVVRSNTSATSLNEAVALELLAEAGLASQDAVATRFTVNGSDPVLRLVIEHPDDVWMADNFDAGDALYKAVSTGDYTYRGDDAQSYDEVFDQEAGTDNTDLTPLIEFLDFINNADDATFATELDQWLDVDAFTTYLAMQDIVDNFDDIDGPGNNSYLHYDSETERFTVVPWDYNLAFGAGPGGGGFNGGGGLEPGAGVEPVEGFDSPAGGRRVGPGAGVGAGPGQVGDNPLVERFNAVPVFAELYQTRLAELTAALVDSGRAQSIIDTWTDLLTDQASDLVDTTTITSEAQSISASLAGGG